MNWKRKLKRILVTGVIVSIVLTLTSCCNQKYVPQERIKIVQTHKIDTCFVVKQDTLNCFETDTLKVETYIHDTIVRLKVETKPIIVRDTIISVIEKEKAKKEEEQAKENPKKTKIFFAFLICFIVSGFLTFRKKK